MISSLKNRLFVSIPPSWRHRAVELKNKLWGGWKHTTYAHFGEDAFIDAFFRQTKNGFFVDVGAHHPKRYSNTALLYERGWSGINIDPDSHLLKAFRKDRKRDINLNYGVALNEGALLFHRFSDPAVNTFSSENATRLRKKPQFIELDVEKIKVKPLAAILSEHVPEGRHIDFLNIDAEDFDLEVLQSSDWDSYKPTVIAVEDRLFDPRQPDSSEVYRYLVAHGYIFVAYLGLTLVLVEKKYLGKQINKRLN